MIGRFIDHARGLDQSHAQSVGQNFRKICQYNMTVTLSSIRFETPFCNVK